jgi:hypothetical protein
MRESVQPVPRGELPRREVMQTPEVVAAKREATMQRLRIAMREAAGEAPGFDLASHFREMMRKIREP